MRLYIYMMVVILSSCISRNDATIYNYSPPQYETEIITTSDTLHFPLMPETYNYIRSFNYFIHNGASYISFYDRNSESINIYLFNEQSLVKRLALKELLPRNKLYKTTVFSKNLDSIYITDGDRIFLLNGSGKIIDSTLNLGFYKHAVPTFENSRPPYFKDGEVYTGRRTADLGTFLSSLKEWKVIYRINLKNSKQESLYSLPSLYYHTMFGYDFLDYSFCHNNNGDFIFSFPADSNIYKSNLNEINIAYSGKSRYQKTSIGAVSKEEIFDTEKRQKSFLLRDSYGPVYFDHHARIFLRIAEQKIDEPAYNNKVRRKRQTVILFDERLSIIGESEIGPDISNSTLFITHDGKVYARTYLKDEYALHFVRLEYRKHEEHRTQLSINN